MHRVDGPGVLPGGHFTAGNKQAGIPGTWVTAEWAEAVQEELCAVVTAAGLALNKAANNQVALALEVLMLRAVPVGTVKVGYFTNAPTGFLLANGAVVLRIAYPRLFAHAQAQGFVATEAAWAAGAHGLFGEGDGSTTFRLPRLGGEFLRFADMGAGIDAGRGVGTWQADQNKAHTHGVAADEGGWNGASGNVVSGTDRPQVYIAQTSSSGGTEARPRNIALAAAIRF